MPINFYYEMQHAVHNLKKAESYSECEKVIVSNIKQHLAQNCSDQILKTYLGELSRHLEHLAESGKGLAIDVNYRHTCGFIASILTMPSVRKWIQTTGL